MGIGGDSHMLLCKGAQHKVEKVSAHSLSLISKYTIKNYDVRHVNEIDKSVSHSKVHYVFKYPAERMDTIETEDGYSVALTPDTEIYTLYGWMKAGDIKVGDNIFVNGIDTPPYADKETLRKLYYDEHMTQTEIAERLGVSPRTIRLYIHKLGLEKGIVAKQMGSDNKRYKGGDVSIRGGYGRTHEIYDKLLTGKCAKCGRELPTQIHHINRNPTDTSPENIIELCDLCHAMEHHGYVIKWVRPSTVSKIRYGGVEESVGFELESGDNVVADGFILRFSRMGAEDIKEF